MYDMAVQLVTEHQQASISWLQRRLRVGYNRAARMIERMEREGVVSPASGARSVCSPRKPYDSPIGASTVFARVAAVRIHHPPRPPAAVPRSPSGARTTLRSLR